MDKIKRSDFFTFKYTKELEKKQIVPFNKGNLKSITFKYTKKLKKK